MRPPSPLHHLRPYEACQTDRREQLQIEIGLPDLVADRRKCPGSRGAGVVHQDVDAPECVHGRCVGARDVFCLGHVARNDMNASPCGSGDTVPRFLEDIRAPGQQGDIRAGFRHPGRDREADALAGAGNQGDPSCETHVHDGSSTPSSDCRDSPPDSRGRPRCAACRRRSDKSNAPLPAGGDNRRRRPAPKTRGRLQSRRHGAGWPCPHKTLNYPRYIADSRLKSPVSC